MSIERTERAPPLMGLGTLAYLYRRRLRVHAVQEMFGAVGVAVAVTLVFATIVAAASIAGSARAVVHAVIGPASLQLHARDAEGFPQQMLTQAERLPGVKAAGPLLEQTATVQGADGRNVTVNLAGADTSLAVLDGLAHTLPRATLSSSGIGLSRRSAQDLGITSAQAQAGTAFVTLRLRGRSIRLNVSTVLGSETFGALSQARVAVMQLEQLQALAGLSGRISRVLVEVEPGRQKAVRRELEKLAAGHVDVAQADEDVGLLRQALRPSDQASAFFATISALLGVLLAFTALLLTVPERRRAIADLRLIGTKRSAIAQMLMFQALCLGVAGSLVGLAGGYALSRSLLAQSPRYLSEAFTLGTNTIVGLRPLLIALGGGIGAACLASAAPLLDLRRGRALDAVYREHGAPGNTLSDAAQRGLAVAAGVLLAFATALFATTPSHALLACIVLAFATVFSTPLAFAAVLHAARRVAHRVQSLTILPVALSSLRATPLRSIALAATGAVALFGSVALGGARGDLLRGVQHFAQSYSAEAQIWIGNPGDNQATVPLRLGDLRQRIANVPGVAKVDVFAGGFLQMHGRRVWLIARPAQVARHLLAGQLLDGGLASATKRLAQGGWVVVSRQLAEAQHSGIGGTLTLATPHGPARLRIAATSTNLAWSPGVVFMSNADYRRLWKGSAPTALGIHLARGSDPAQARRSIQRALGPSSGLEVLTARERERSVDTLVGEALRQIGQISTLLLVAAILAMAAALASAIWQRRVSLAGLRLAGVRPYRLRLILLSESALMLGAGCATGALAGVYGQLVIDRYLNYVTGFPVATLGASLRPLEVFALVTAAVLVLAAVPGWLASRVSPALAFNE